MRNKEVTCIDEIISQLKSKVERSYNIDSKLVIGWYCTYVPEEIFYAAGFIPNRIIGKPISICKAKSYLQGNLNPFVQSCLECALNGDYNSFVGIVIGNSDDATRRMYDVWKKYIKPSFIYLLDIPKRVDENSIRSFSEDLSSLINLLENHFKIEIKKDSLWKAIKLCNETRTLLQKINDLRKEKKPPLTSNQFLEIAKLSTIYDKEIFNNELNNLFEELLSCKEYLPDELSRILITGSFQDQPWLAKCIEDLKGYVVCEDLCTRCRYFYGIVDLNLSDPVYAIAKRYLTKPPCARMLDLNRRFEHLLSLIKEFKIDGVIYYCLKFDDPYLFEFPDIREKLISQGIPILFIESEHRQSAPEQIRTRIQAFLETL